MEADEVTQAALLQRARLHNALVMVTRRLSGLDGLSESVRQQIRQTQVVAIARDLQLFNTAALVMRALREAGVEAMTYKGPVLWRALGLSGPSKVSSDVDVIVRPDDLRNADAVLEGLGYRCVDMDPHEASYGKPDRPSVDLHWDLLNGGWGHRFAGFVEQAFSDGAVVEEGTVQISTFGPADTILVLALHAGCHHLCSDWASLCDMAQCTLVWQDRIDWERLLRTANVLGVRGALYYPLLLAGEHFGAVIPQEVMRGLNLPFCHLCMRQVAVAGFYGRVRGAAQLRIGRIAWNLLSKPTVGSFADWVKLWVWHHARPRPQFSEDVSIGSVVGVGRDDRLE